MPAVIQSTLYESPGGAVVPGSTQANSRDDLRLGYQVALHSVHEATTYSWALAFASDSPGSTVPGTPFDGTQSSSALSASTTRDCTFNVDFEGTYLIRLVVDAGLPGEDTQFIRARALTIFGALKLVAAGERRDEKGVIPVDATPEGWANDQNANLQRISILLRRYATSGRVLYVDANRGRDNTADQDDYDNLISLPGTEPARPEETGIKLRAMAHGDFSSINDAIAYAAAAAARGEPAPSKTNPYFIHIRPGFYNEDLNLTSFVHLIGEWHAVDIQTSTQLPSGPLVKPVVIRSLNTAGTGTHTYNPALPATTDECFLSNLYLENTANTTNPTIFQQGGLLLLDHCVVLQRGGAVNQGQAVACVTANPAHAPMLVLISSQVSTLATTADCLSVELDAPNGALLIVDSRIYASDATALGLNKTLYETSFVVLTDGSEVTGLGAITGYPSDLQMVNSSSGALGSPPANPAIDITPPGGVGAKPGDVIVSLESVKVVGKIRFLTANAVGTTRLEQSGVIQVGVTPGAEGVELPDAPGVVPDLKQYMRADSIWYIKGFQDYRQGPLSGAVIPLNNQVPEEDVQRILDLLWRGTFPVNGSPFFDLNAAYNGLATISPFVPGVGLGRDIQALGGAVQIQGAVYPTGLEDDLKYGGLQVEGIVDIGGTINGAPGSLVAFVGGSEIHLNPSFTGGGPFIGLGRALWPAFAPVKDRGFGGASIVAGGALPPTTGDEAWHLHLRTADRRTPNTGKTGNIYMVAGATNAANEAGELHLVGGSHRVNGGTVGNVWLVPGGTDTPDTGVVWFVGAPAAGAGALRAALVPANAFVAGTAGTIVFGTPAGIEVFTLTGVEANSGAAATVINTQARGIFAADVGGKVVLYSEYGPAGDIIYMGDDVGGALNTALGNYIQTAGAVLTPGAYGNKVSVDVPVNGRLRVNGDLEYTGSLIPAPGLNSYKAVLPVDTPYTTQVSEDIFGVRLGAGADIVVDLNAAYPAGAAVIIKDENFIANAVPAPVGQKITITDNAAGLIEGGATYDITVGGGAVTLYKNDAGNWFIF